MRTNMLIKYMVIQNSCDVVMHMAYGLVKSLSKKQT